MELPPYRWPTGRGLLFHMWERSRHYIKKMGGVILIASLVLWALSVFPRPPQAVSAPEAGAAPQATESIEYSIMGRTGKAIEPVLRPLGFDWQLGVPLLAGFVAKEVVVSSLAVIYQVGEEEDEALRAGLTAALRDPANRVTPLVAVAYMVFVLLYTPCIVSILTIRREIGARWMWFDVGYQLLLAWLVAFGIVQIGRLLGLG
jgi:ferrous iron transport protein B